jgi:MFS family permease
LDGQGDIHYQFLLSMFAMTALGVGEIVGAIIMGILVDKIGSKKSSLVNVGLVFI